MGGGCGKGAASSFRSSGMIGWIHMRQQNQTTAPLRSDISEILRAWHVALAAARASEEADLYACAVALAMESFDGYTTVQDLIGVYCAPDDALKARVLALCDEGEVHLESGIVMGSACALQFRQIMEKAIA
jgi:hypothetical protein